MKHLKKFESFSSPAPTTKPAEPITKPGTRPNRPSPIRRDRPSVDPAPKAKNKKLSMATSLDVVNRYYKDSGIKESVINVELELENMFSSKDWFHRVDLTEKNDDYTLVLYTNRPLTKSEMRDIPRDVDGVSVIVELTNDKNIKMK